MKLQWTMELGQPAHPKAEEEVVLQVGSQVGRDSWGEPRRQEDPGSSAQDLTFRHLWDKTGVRGGRGGATDCYNSESAVWMPPKGRPGLCISEKGSLFHFKAADEGMDAMSLIWPVMSPQKQPFGQEFFPETSLLPGVKSPAEGAALACNGGTSSPGMKGGVPGAPAAAGEFGGG